jgi:hypothetical protein
MEIKTEKVNEPSTPTAAESTIKKSVEVSKDVQPKEELKYSQKDLDNITDKVRTTSSKELSSKIEEIQNQFEQYKQQVQRDKMKMTFVQKFGGNEKAFDALVKSNPDLVKSQDFEKDLRILKGTQQF